MISEVRILNPAIPVNVTVPNGPEVHGIDGVVGTIGTNILGEESAFTGGGGGGTGGHPNP